MNPTEGTKLTAARAAVLVFLSALVVHLAFGFCFGFPVPDVHDEFAYLLSADTFAEGRLTNPTHPQWVHFETFHVFHEPTYQSKYPPGQGASLALGQVAAGHAAYGIWLVMALGAGAIAWLLSALVPVRWALVGTLLFVLNYTAFRQWGHSYWGGGVAMLGGALFLGGLLHLRHALRLRYAAVAGLGMIVSANSRPLETLVLVLMVLPFLVGGMTPFVRSEGARRVLLRVALPLALAGLALVLFTLYYDARLTGDPWSMPHFHWNHHASSHADIRAYSGSPEKSFLGKMQRMQQFFLGNVLFLSVPFLLRRRRSTAVVASGALVATLTLLSVLGTRGWPHYVAPVTGLIVYLLVECLRSLSEVRVGRLRIGLGAVIALIAVHLVMNVGWLARDIRNGPRDLWQFRRQALVEELEQREGQHLVLVQYLPQRPPIKEEWIYNAADIDAAKIVWARDLGPERNEGLLRHFAGRRVWRLEPAVNDEELLPYAP